MLGGHQNFSYLNISGITVDLWWMVNLPVVRSPCETVLGSSLPWTEVGKANRDPAPHGLRAVHGGLRTEVDHLFAVDLCVRQNALFTGGLAMSKQLVIRQDQLT